MRKLRNEELKRLSKEEFTRSEKIPVIVVLDNVRSLHNVGSVFRTADAFRVASIYLCGITATPPHREIHKTALGADETVNWQHFESCAEAVADLKSRQWMIWAVEQAEGSIPLDELHFTEGLKAAVIFGNEINGIGEDVMKLADVCVEIPQTGTKHSLNISVSAGIVIWELWKKLNG